MQRSHSNDPSTLSTPRQRLVCRGALSDYWPPCVWPGRANWPLNCTPILLISTLTQEGCAPCACANLPLAVDADAAGARRCARQPRHARRSIKEMSFGWTSGHDDEVHARNSMNVCVCVFCFCLSVTVVCQLLLRLPFT